eukprot:gene5319-3821_t
MDDESIQICDDYREIEAPLVGLRKRENAFTSCAEIFYYAGNENSCFSCFVHFRLDTANDASNPFIRMLWSYPAPPARVLADYPNLGKFIFADRTLIDVVRDLSYTFVLTDASGVRTYGHGTAFTNGEAVVVLSPYPWCNFFARLAHLFRANGEQGKQVIKMLYGCHTPPSGAPFLVPLELGITFTRPYDRLCSFVDTSPVSILEMFEVDTLFMVLADLLLEKHIIVVGPSFSIVSTTIMSLLALVAPFDWMHILIPILPTGIIDVLAAPPPYLIGLLTSQLPYVTGIPIESVVMVHLDECGRCQRVEHIKESEDRLPHSGPLSALSVGLRILKWRLPMEHTARDLCSLFLTYYATLFGNVIMRGAKAYLKQEPHSVPAMRFFQRLVSTQSFSILSAEIGKAMNANNLDWLDNEFIVATVRAHRTLFPDHYDVLVREEQEGGGYIEKYNECFGSGEDFTSWTAAVHGFGGQNVGITSIISHCICGRCALWLWGEGFEERHKSARFRRSDDVTIHYQMALLPDYHLSSLTSSSGRSRGLILEYGTDIVSLICLLPFFSFGFSS